MIEKTHRYLMENPIYHLSEIRVVCDELLVDFIRDQVYVTDIRWLSLNRTAYISIDRRYDIDACWLDLDSKLHLECLLVDVNLDELQDKED